MSYQNYPQPTFSSLQNLNQPHQQFQHSTEKPDDIKLNDFLGPNSSQSIPTQSTTTTNQYNQSIYDPNYHKGFLSDDEATTTSDDDDSYDDDKLFGYNTNIDSDDDELIPRAVQRSTGSLKETLSRFQCIKQKEDEYIKKLEDEKYLETHEQEQLVHDMREHAQIMASIWRYICLFCTISWSVVVNMMLLMYLVFDYEISFYHTLFEHIDLPQFLIAQIPLSLSTFSTIHFASEIPRFSDIGAVFSTSLVILSTVMYFFTLLFIDLLTIHDLLIPIFNIINFGIVCYAYYNIHQSYQLINELKKAKYKYQTI